MYCVYWQSQYVSDIKTSVIYQNGSPAKIILDYVMSDPNNEEEKNQHGDGRKKSFFSSTRSDK